MLLQNEKSWFLSEIFVNFLVREYCRLGDVQLDEISRTTRWVKQEHSNIGKFIGELARHHPLFEAEANNCEAYQKFVVSLKKSKILPEVKRELRKEKVAAALARLTEHEHKKISEILCSDLSEEESQKAIRAIMGIHD